MAVITVGSSAYDPVLNTGDDTATVEGALNSVAPGDTVIFEPGEYRFTRQLLIANFQGLMQFNDTVLLWRPITGDITDAGATERGYLDLGFYGELDKANTVFLFVESDTEISGAAVSAPRNANLQRIKSRGRVTLQMNAPNDDGEGGARVSSLMAVWGRNPTWFDTADLTDGVFAPGKDIFNDPSEVRHKTVSTLILDLEDMVFDTENPGKANGSLGSNDGGDLSFGLFVTGSESNGSHKAKPINADIRLHRCSGSRASVALEGIADNQDLNGWVLRTPTEAVPASVQFTECILGRGRRGFGCIGAAAHADLLVRDCRLVIDETLDGSAAAGVLGPLANEFIGPFADPTMSLWYPSWAPSAKKHAIIKDNIIICKATGGFFEGVESGQAAGISAHNIVVEGNVIELADGFAHCATIGAHDRAVHKRNIFLGSGFAGLNLDGGTKHFTDNDYSKASLVYEVAHDDFFADVLPNDSVHYVSDDKKVLRGGSNNRYLDDFRS